tara:strand:+ start:442 stop:909 length:468 start_codon:yes stop_codon:yes gene_type:complete
MYRGTGKPQLVSMELNKTITLPTPLKNKRKEEFKDEKKVYTNIRGTRIPMKSKFRFIGEYEFGEMSSNTIDDLVTLNVRQSVCKFIPHADTPYINYKVLLKEISPEYFGGNVYKDTMTMKVESVDYVYSIPTIDNMLKSTKTTHVGVYQENDNGL